MEQVVVVGAGSAGLTAAHRLEAYSPLVLEAEDYVGGRTKSISLPNGLWCCLGATFLDVGAQKLAAEVGVEVVGSDALTATGHLLPAIYYGGKRVIADDFESWFSQLPLSTSARQDFRNLQTRLEEARAASHDDSRLDNVTLADWLGPLDPSLEGLLQMWATVAGASKLTDVSAVAGLDIVEATLGRAAGGGPFASLGGTSMLHQAIAARLGHRVVKSARVTRIEPDNDSVRITYVQDGREHEVASRCCVVSIPAPSVAEICRDLPAAKLKALRKLRYAKAMVLGVSIDDGGPSPWKSMIWLRSDSPPISNIINPMFPLGERSGPSTLDILISGNMAEDAWQLSDEEIVEASLDELTRIFPETKGRVHVHALQRWERAYSARPPGYEQISSALADSVGNVFFCGDYLIGVSVENAIRTGEAAAKQIKERLADA